MCFACSLANQHTVFKWKDAISRFPVSQMQKHYMRSRQYVWTPTYQLGDRLCRPQRILRARPSIFWCTMWRRRRRAVQQGCSPVQPRATSPASAAIHCITKLQSETTHAFIAITSSYHTSVRQKFHHSYVVQKRILGLDTALSCYSDVCSPFYHLLMAQCSTLVMTLYYVLYSSVYFRFLCFVMACVLSRHK